jgi:hypothetical protein
MRRRGEAGYETPPPARRRGGGVGPPEGLRARRDQKALVEKMEMNTGFKDE